MISSSSAKTAANCRATPSRRSLRAVAARCGSRTANGLACYRDKALHTYSTKDGLPDNAISGVLEDHAGAVWMVAGINLSRFENGKFTNFRPGVDLPISAVRAIYEDREHTLWIGGYGGVAKRVASRFVSVIGSDTLGVDIIMSLLRDRQDNLWIAGSRGLLVVAPSGEISRYDEARRPAKSYRPLALGGSRRQHLGGHQQRTEPAGSRAFRRAGDRRRPRSRLGSLHL